MTMKNLAMTKGGPFQFSMREIPFYGCIAFVCVGIVPMFWGALAGHYLTYIYAVLLALWAIDFGNCILRRRNISYMYGLLLIYVFALMLFAVMNVYNFRAYFITVFVALFPAIIYCQFESRIDDGTAGIAAGMLLLLYLVTFATTISGFLEDPYLVRNLVVDLHDQRFAYMAKNVGNVGHVYTAGLLFVTCMSRIRSMPNYPLFKKVVFLVAMGLSATMVVMGSSGITLLSVIVGSIWAVSLKRENRLRFAIVAIVLILFLVFRESIADILSSASRSVDNAYISKKMQDLALSMTGGEAVGDVAARTDRYWASFRVFLNSFGLGVGPQYAQVYSGNIVDGHSDLFAGLARYGILWLVVMTAFFKRFCQRMEYASLMRTGQRSDNEPVIIAFLMMFVLQPISMSEEIMAYTFLVLPYFDLIFKSSQQMESRRAR